MVDNTFDDHVQQHAITRTQTAQAEINKQFTALRQEMEFYVGTPDFSLIPVSARLPAHLGQ
ncbi:hypothetical protein ISX56_01795 [Serratia ureilytica]|nr:hypothetical protein [Serratia ureilytica]